MKKSVAQLVKVVNGHLLATTEDHSQKEAAVTHPVHVVRMLEEVLDPGQQKRQHLKH
jgi:hypothetical protein